MSMRSSKFEFAPEKSWDDEQSVSDASVSRVLALGDIHGNRRSLKRAINKAAELEADVIVQVGDFWLGDSSWSRFSASEAHYMWDAYLAPLPIVVIDGNHEVWPSLARFSSTQEAQAAFAARRPVHLGGSVWWAWRGSAWSWSGLRFGALGGAVSPDLMDPVVRHYRWAEAEAMTQDDLDRFLSNMQAEHDGELDVLFTHDAPFEVMGLNSTMAIPWNVREDIREMRKLLSQAVRSTRPKHLLHGHWHQRNHERINDDMTEVFGLCADNFNNNAADMRLLPEPEIEHATT